MCLRSVIQQRSHRASLPGCIRTSSCLVNLCHVSHVILSPLEPVDCDEPPWRPVPLLVVPLKSSTSCANEALPGPKRWHTDLGYVTLMVWWPNPQHGGVQDMAVSVKCIMWFISVLEMNFVGSLGGSSFYWRPLYILRKRMQYNIVV